MNSIEAKRIFSVMVSLILINVLLSELFGYQTTGSAPADDPGVWTTAAAQSTSQLEALVAPLTLHPDSLVAQISTASTFPDQVAIAEYWLEQNKT